MESIYSLKGMNLEKTISFYKIVEQFLSNVKLMIMLLNAYVRMKRMKNIDRIQEKILKDFKTLPRLIGPRFYIPRQLPKAVLIMAFSFRSRDSFEDIKFGRGISFGTLQRPSHW
jgi:hypothetical protein